MHERDACIWDRKMSTRCSSSPPQTPLETLLVKNRASFAHFNHAAVDGVADLKLVTPGSGHKRLKPVRAGPTKGKRGCKPEAQTELQVATPDGRSREQLHRANCGFFLFALTQINQLANETSQENNFRRCRTGNVGLTGRPTAAPPNVRPNCWERDGHVQPSKKGNQELHCVSGNV